MAFNQDAYFDVQRDAFDKFPKQNKIVIVGARGIGKTYSALRNTVLSGKKFLFIRRLEREASAVGSELGNPFKKLNTQGITDVSVSYSAKDGLGLFYVKTEEEKKRKTVKNPTNVIGYLSALSIFSGLRGIDFSDVDIIIFDEFIPEPNKPFLKDEFILLQNLYETVNRNREFDGEKPVDLLLMSNATSLRSPILIGYDLVVEMENIITDGKREYAIKNDVVVILPKMEEFVKAKKETSLYKNNASKDFVDEALYNVFTKDSFKNCKVQPLREYLPWVGIDDIYIYRHKTNGKYYACRSRTDCQHFVSTDNMLLFRAYFGTAIANAIVAEKMYYYDYSVKIALCDMFNVGH